MSVSKTLKREKRGKIFNYVAYDQQGSKYAGFIEALNENEALKLLKSFGYTNIKVGELKPFQYFFIKNFIKLSKNDVMLFTRMVSEMLKAGFPVSRLFDVIALTTTNKKLALICLVIKENLRSGYAISNALERYTDVFSPIYVALIKIGEKTGQLSDIMDELAKYTEEEYKVRSKLISSLIYPLLIIIVSILITWGLIVFIFPKLFEILQGFEVEIPLLTKILLSISNVLGNPIVLAIGFVSGFFIYTILRIFEELSPVVKEKIELLLFSLPYMGNIMYKIYELRLARAFLLVYRSGMSFLEGLRNLEESFNSGILKKVIVKMQKYLKEGEYLTVAAYKTRFFDPFFLDMLKTGEETGELDRLLDKICYNLEFEIKQKIDTLLSLFEPMLIVFVGLIVAIILLAVFLPISSIIQGVTKF
jgi:type II secretory pathway component PulF